MCQARQAAAWRLCWHYRIPTRRRDRFRHLPYRCRMPARSRRRSRHHNVPDWTIDFGQEDQCDCNRRLDNNRAHLLWRWSDRGRIRAELPAGRQMVFQQVQQDKPRHNLHWPPSTALLRTNATSRHSADGNRRHPQRPVHTFYQRYYQGLLHARAKRSRELSHPDTNTNRDNVWAHCTADRRPGQDADRPLEPHLEYRSRQSVFDGHNIVRM